ncbi:MAG: hybrid sensor histidine kinase/response regulator [Chloroflexi bacterium]|nr:hybrid sensor histidine kinase/response regulator [Chloroflexota bacterium]
MRHAILLVEDNPGDARLIREMIREVQDASFLLERVERLTEGIARLGGGDISAVLLDLSLPDSQGLESFRRLHAHAPDVPILVLTGLDDEELGLQAIREGAQDYLIKGRVDGHLLIRALRYAIERKRQEAALRFLVETSRSLALSLDPGATVEQVAQLAVPVLADLCIVDLLQEERLEPVAAAHVDSGAVPGLLERHRGFLRDDALAQSVQQAVRERRSILLSPQPVVAGEDRAISPRWTGIVVPLVARGRTMGAIYFEKILPHNDHAMPDLWLYEEFGRRAALAIDNAQLLTKALEAARLRDSVLSSVSHDLRNPLMVVKIIAETLAFQIRSRDVPNSAEIIEGLERIDAATVKMTALIDDLLDVAQMQAGGRIRLRRRQTDLVALIQGVIADYRVRAPRHRLRTEFAVPVLTGWWDAARLERVIGNLLANAIKYSPPSSEVIIRLFSEQDADGEWATVEVEDHGVGIPAADLPRIFTWFYRGQNVADRTTGSGIGLAGARQIVELHGGTITVQSAEGKGSLFRVRLPLGEAGDDSEDAEVDQ